MTNPYAGIPLIVDRKKFERDHYVLIGWSVQARKWFCSLSRNSDDADVPAVAAGEGSDPLEAMIAMCMDLGAISPEKGSIQ